MKEQDDSHTRHIILLFAFGFISSIVGFIITLNSWVAASFLFINAAFYLHFKEIKRSVDEVIKDMNTPKKAIELKMGSITPMFDTKTGMLSILTVIEISAKDVLFHRLPSDDKISIPIDELDTIPSSIVELKQIIY